MDNKTLAEKHIPLARKLAWERYYHLNGIIPYDDLQAAAFMGLVEAANKFDSSLDCSFSYYVKFRIGGAMTDHLREIGFLKKSIDDIDEEPIAATPSRIEELIDHLTSILDDVGKNIIKMRYLDNLTLKEIGGNIGCKKSRASQLLDCYHQKLRNYFKIEDLTEAA